MIRSRTNVARLMAILFVGCVAFWSVGCSCSTTPKPKNAANPRKPLTGDQTIDEMEEQRRKLDAERDEKPDFEIVDLRVLPTDEKPKDDQSRKPMSHVKPGHWFGAVQRLKANNFDFPKGDLEAQCIDNQVRPVKLPGNFELLTSRSVSLPKGQEKNADLVLFAPIPPKDRRETFSATPNQMYFMSRLHPRGGGRQLEWRSELAVNMKASENHFVVLADKADNYQFIKNLRLTRPEREGEYVIEAPIDYHIKLPKGTQRVDLSSHSLTWSTVAYVLWDDFDPDILSISQQQAMLDWLHWGGQLVVNGPRTLDRLAGSFLDDYLPARAGKTTKISDEQFATLNEHWSFVEPADFRKLQASATDEPASDGNGTNRQDRSPMTFDLTVKDEAERPLSIELKKSDGSHFIKNTADLIAEKHVGRGSVRVTAFNLPHPVFRRWAGFDGMVNSCLLGRASRRFFADDNTGQVYEKWNIGTGERDDPRTTSQVRYFSRDASSQTGESKKKNKRTSDDYVSDEEQAASAVSHLLPPSIQATYGMNGFAQDPVLGVAGWSDKSAVSQRAANALRTAAGVDVPEASFVAKVLGLYLVLLVPVNWLFFRLIGRVEWAWAMIPLFSIGGAIGVIRAAQLDIGFVRSRTEIAVLELQPGYDRAHTTRYIGFYTSLSSAYEITGEDESSLILPLEIDQRTSNNVSLRFSDTVEMTGLSVSSNSTGMIHTEQMLNVGGTIDYSPDKDEVSNQTSFDLKGVVLVRRTSHDVVEAARVGDLQAKASLAAPDFRRLDTKLVEFESWEADPTTSRVEQEDGLNVRRVIDLATDPARLGIGEMVLVGWTEKLVPGIAVKPKASQVVARTVIVAQLNHADRPEPQRDANSYAVQRAIAKRNQFGFDNRPTDQF